MHRGHPQSEGTFSERVMDTDILVLSLYVLLALGVSFLCSIAEAVLLSLTPSYIEGLKVKFPKRAAVLKKLKQDQVDRSLAAILTLNTIAHTVGAIGAGAKATDVFGDTWFGVFSAAMTLMILFLSEIIPKTIGAVYWSKLVGPTAVFVNSLITLLFPVVWISEKLTRLISGDRQLDIFSKDEFLAMASVGEKAGKLRTKESRIIRNLFKFDSILVEDIMTPRTVITALSEDTLTSDSIESMSKTPFSRIPVFKNDIDEITGFVLKLEVLMHNAGEKGNNPLEKLKRKILTVPESVSLSNLLERFLKERQHIAVVVDEYGGTRGLVSMEDIIETLVGVEIMDETDSTEDMRLLARERWELRAKRMKPLD